jgi:arylsulfatase A-like enzyme
MCYPGVISPERKTDALFSHVDFAPTLLSFCGLQIPAEMQGADLSLVAAGKAEEGPGSVLFQIFGPYHAGGVERAWRGLRTARYMYARWESGPWLLYDFHTDPYELRNLAHDPAYSAELGELDQQLVNSMHRVGDSWSLNWTAPVEDDERLDKYRAFYTVQDYLAWAKNHPSLAPGVP